MRLKSVFIKKAIAYGVSSLLLLGTVSAANVSYAAGYQSMDSRFTIDRLSNSTAVSGEADGLINGGDRENSYTWAQTELGDYIYLGSNRNIMYTFAREMNQKINDWDLTHAIITDMSDGAIPIPKVKGDINSDEYYNNFGQVNEASLFRYNTKTGVMEQVLKNEDAGYRSAVTFTPKGSDKAYAYFGTFTRGASISRVIQLDKDSALGDYETVYESTCTSASIRSMTVYKDTLCIGSLTVGAKPLADSDENTMSLSESDVNSGNLQILQSADPNTETDAWKEIANIHDFEACDPRTDAMSVAMSGVWDMITFNDAIYAFIGTGYDEDRDETNGNGFSVFKGTEVGIGTPGANAAGWKWQMIVGPQTYGGETTGASYAPGMGEKYNGAASPFLFKAPDGKEYVYVGTFTSVFDTIESTLKFDLGPTNDMMVPAQMYRFGTDDKWEMVIGNPVSGGAFTTKIGNKYAGFSDTTSKLDSSNLYLWRMAQYNGKLFVGTFDVSPMYDYIVMPYKIDLESYSNDQLVKFLFMISKLLPEEVSNNFGTALKAYNEIKADAESATLKANETQKVYDSGNAALDAVSKSALNINDTDFSNITNTSIAIDLASDAAVKAELFASDAANATVTYSGIEDVADLSAEASALALNAYNDVEAAVVDLGSDANKKCTAFDAMKAALDKLQAAVTETDTVNDAAIAERDEAVGKAAQAETQLNAARTKVNDGYKKVQKLLNSPTLDQYKTTLELLQFLEEYCPELSKNQLEKLIEIVELRIMIDSAVKGFDLYVTDDGKNFSKITDSGFNDKYNYGLRTFLPTSKGLFIGTANPFYGAQLWKLDLASVTPSGGSGHSHSGGSSATTTTPATATTPAAVTSPAITLADIQNHWAKEYIEKLLKLGIVTGNPNGTFEPDKAVTRAEFAVMLVNAFKLKGENGKDFADTVSHWSKNYVRIAADNGVIKGVDADHFMPNDLITREEMAAMIARALKITAANQTLTCGDSELVSDWAVPSVAAVLEKEVMSVDAQNLFDPKSNATKAMSAVVIVRALELK